VVLSWAAITVPAAAAASTTTIKLTPASVTVGPGRQASIDVAISTDVPVRGVQTKFVYDPTAIHIENVTEGSFFKDWAAKNGATSNLVFPFTPDNTAGQTKVGGLALFGGQPNQGTSGQGTLLTIHVTGAPLAHGSSTIDLDKLVLADAAGQPVEVEASGTSIAVGPPGIAAPPAPTPVVWLVAPRPVAESLSPIDLALGWLRRNTCG
jgi:hypothetical protein